MVLDNINAAKIAAHFGNKWQVVEYCGCWGKTSISFAMYQDRSENAGFELIIKRPEGDYLSAVEVVKVKPIYTTQKDSDRQWRRYRLPFLIP